jgi:hypothetical protein
MNQGTQGYCLPKKTEGQKSCETVPLMCYFSKKKKKNVTSSPVLLTKNEFIEKINMSS